MSFGTATPRYQSQITYGKGVPPWQQGARNDNKKKFNYKEKVNKIPLRDRLKQAEQEKLLQEAEREAHLRANKMLAERRRREMEAKAMTEKSHKNGILKRTKAGANSDYVTLTQDQLSTILKTLSKVQGSSNEVTLDVEDSDHLKLTLDKPDSSESFSREASNESSISAARQLESVLNLSRRVKTTPDSVHKDSGHHDTRNAKADTGKNRSRKQVVMNFNLNGADAKNKSDHPINSKTSTGKVKKQVKIIDKENYDDEELVFTRQPAKVVVIQDDAPANNNEISGYNPPDQPDSSSMPEQQSELSPRQKLMRIPRAHMTKGEKKRLQWELENEAMEKLKKENETRARRLGIHIDLPDTKVETSAAVTVTAHNMTVKDKSYNKDNYSDKTEPTKNGNKGLTRSQMREAAMYVEPDFVPGLGELSKPEYTQHSKDSSTKLPSKPASGDKVLVKSDIQEAVQPPMRPHVQPAMLSKAELKRLQWDKEIANAPAEYDPWGRPGVGVGPKNITNRLQDQHPPPQQSHRNQRLTSQEQQQQLQQRQHNDVYQEQSSQSNATVIESSFVPGLDNKSDPINYAVRAPFQEPTTGVPTSLVGLENPQRDLSKPASLGIRDSLTKAQLLRLKWAEEKAANLPEYNPYGKPGAGAPIRSDSGTVLTSYSTRQKQMIQKTIEQHHQHRIPNDASIQTQNTAHTGNVSEQNSIIPPPSLNSSRTNAGHVENSFALPLPTEDENVERNHIRGQLVNVDAATLKEREEQRRRELRHQEDIRHQVEEKQRLKKEERMRKLKEEAEEEAKFRAEKSSQQQQYDQTREKNKLKEAKEVSRADLVAEAMQRAKHEAELLKARRRLEKLQAAGHDITHLKAAYEEKFSPRIVGSVISDALTPRRGDGGAQSFVPADVLSPRALNSQSYNTNQLQTVEPTIVPGLDLSPRTNYTRQDHGTSRTANDGGYTSNRILTPHKWKSGAQHKENELHLKEFGVQTDSPIPKKSSKQQQKERQLHTDKKIHAANIKKQVRVISGPKSRKPKEPQEPKPWGWKNQAGKKFTAQSKRDPYFGENQEDKIVKNQARKEHLLKQVEANRKHIPDGRNTRTNVEVSNRDRDTVNSYLSPRYKLTSSISPRDSRLDNRKPSRNQHLTKREDDSSTSGNPKNIARESTENTKAKSKAKSGPPGYELSLPDNLRVSPDNEYVPFRRSDAVLSPSNAQDPSPMSREHTHVALAREAYYKTMQPAQYGIHMHNIKDTHQPSVSKAVPPPHSKDPLYNPSVLTNHPTDRQKQVLESLRQMRQGLMAKQREIEAVVTPDGGAMRPLTPDHYNY